jgi:hypothetical protein
VRGGSPRPLAGAGRVIRSDRSGSSFRLRWRAVNGP